MESDYSYADIPESLMTPFKHHLIQELAVQIDWMKLEKKLKPYTKKYIKENDVQMAIEVAWMYNNFDKTFDTKSLNKKEISLSTAKKIINKYSYEGLMGLSRYGGMGGAGFAINDLLRAKTIEDKRAMNNAYDATFELDSLPKDFIFKNIFNLI